MIFNARAGRHHENLFNASLLKAELKTYKGLKVSEAYQILKFLNVQIFCGKKKSYLGGLVSQ